MTSGVNLAIPGAVPSGHVTASPMVRQAHHSNEQGGNGRQSGGNSRFVAKGATRNVLSFLSGDVAERLKAAIC